MKFLRSTKLKSIPADDPEPVLSSSKLFKSWTLISTYSTGEGETDVLSPEPVEESGCWSAFAAITISTLVLTPVLVSQTGAGKTSLRESINPGNQIYVVINPDLYKKFRSDADEIREKDRTHFGALTGIDSYDHADNIRNYAMEKGYNILIEVAPSSKQGLIGVNEKELEEHGYQIDLHVMAVGDLVSALAIHQRYETLIFVYNGKGDTKLTDLDRHDDSYTAVTKCLQNIDPEKVNLYIRSENAAVAPKKIPTEGKTITEILSVLKRERDTSNHEYVVGSGVRSFMADYQNIVALMEKRGAPQEEYTQLNEIYGRYEYYKSRIKDADER